MRIYNCERFNSADSVMFLQACRQYIPVMNTPRSAYCEDNLRHSSDYNGRKGRSRANNVYLILIPSIPLCYWSLIYLFMAVKHNRYVIIT
jgi:hypothetical protein